MGLHELTHITCSEQCQAQRRCSLKGSHCPPSQWLSLHIQVSAWRAGGRSSLVLYLRHLVHGWGKDKLANSQGNSARCLPPAPPPTFSDQPWGRAECAAWQPWPFTQPHSHPGCTVAFMFTKHDPFDDCAPQRGPQTLAPGESQNLWEGKPVF